MPRCEKCKSDISVWGAPMPLTPFTCVKVRNGRKERARVQWVQGTGSTGDDASEQVRPPPKNVPEKMVTLFPDMCAPATSRAGFKLP